jgi:hypothetical protein
VGGSMLAKGHGEHVTGSRAKTERVRHCVLTGICTNQPKTWHGYYNDRFATPI